MKRKPDSQIHDPAVRTEEFRKALFASDSRRFRQLKEYRKQ